MPGYHLFSYSAAPDIMCAIEQDRPIPAFIRAPAWEYVREASKDLLFKLSGRLPVTRGRALPFYVFQVIDDKMVTAPVAYAKRRTKGLEEAAHL